MIFPRASKLIQQRGYVFLTVPPPTDGSVNVEASCPLSGIAKRAGLLPVGFVVMGD